MNTSAIGKSTERTPAASTDAAIAKLDAAEQAEALGMIDSGEAKHA
jgi:hypothetical protein